MFPRWKLRKVRILVTAIQQTQVYLFYSLVFNVPCKRDKFSDMAEEQVSTGHQSIQTRIFCTSRYIWHSQISNFCLSCNALNMSKIAQFLSLSAVDKGTQNRIQYSFSVAEVSWTQKISTIQWKLGSSTPVNSETQMIWLLRTVPSILRVFL